MSTSDAIERFLGTGTFDPRFSAWPGDVVGRRRAGGDELRRVLDRVVAWRVARAPLRVRAAPAGARDRVTALVAPMVEGMFPKDETERLLVRLPARVRVLTLSSWRGALPELDLADAWVLANLLLDELGAPALGDDAPALHGVCAGGSAWVTPRALEPEGPSEVVVHEVAHLLHLLPRVEGMERPTILTVSRPRRETFAYACELWSRLGAFAIEEDGCRAAADRVSDVRVDGEALADLLWGAARDPGGAWALFRDWATGARSGSWVKARRSRIAPAAAAGSPSGMPR